MERLQETLRSLQAETMRPMREALAAINARQTAQLSQALQPLQGFSMPPVVLSESTRQALASVGAAPSLRLQETLREVLGPLQDPLWRQTVESLREAAERAAAAEEGEAEESEGLEEVSPTAVALVVLEEVAPAATATPEERSTVWADLYCLFWVALYLAAVARQVPQAWAALQFAAGNEVRGIFDVLVFAYMAQQAKGKKE